CPVDFHGVYSAQATNVPAPFGAPSTQNPSWTGTNGNSGVYTRGATVVNLSSVTGNINLAVGMNLFLYQSDLPATCPLPNASISVYQNATTGACAREGSRGYALQQIVKVVAINGTAVTISPGIYSDFFTSSLTPMAYWWG